MVQDINVEEYCMSRSELIQAEEEILKIGIQEW